MSQIAKHFDQIIDVARIRAAAYPAEQSTGVEIMTRNGEFMCLALSGAALLGLAEQIRKTFAENPEIVSWASIRRR